MKGKIDVGHFLVQKLEILISAHARAKMSERDTHGKKGITPSKLKCGIPIWKNSEGYWYLMPKKFVFRKGFGLLEGEKEVFS